MKKAKHPIILLGRCSRDIGEWNDRVALAEALNARVVSDLKVGASFPTEHPLHIGKPSKRPSKEQAEAIREADAILALEHVDLGGILKLVFDDKRCPATIVATSMDRYVHNGWSGDHQMMPPVDLDLVVPSQKLVSGMLDVLGRPKPLRAAKRRKTARPPQHRQEQRRKR